MGLNFTILGAGALGSLVGGYLAATGCNVHLVGREHHISTIKKKGLLISGVRGEQHVHVSGSTDTVDIPFSTDVYILSVKQNDTIAVLRSFNGGIADDSILLSFQNGIPFEQMCAAVDKGFKLAAVTGWAATMAAPGKIVHTSDGQFILGAAEQKNDIHNSPKVKTLVETLNMISRSELSDNVIGHLWTKMLIASLYPIFAVGGLTFGDVVGNALVKKIMLAVWREGFSVAQRLGIRLEVFLGRLEPEMLVSNCFGDFMRAGYVIDLMLKDRKQHKPSVLIDLEQGRPTEVPYMNGMVVRQAAQHNIKTPMNDALIKMVYEIEQKKRSITYGNVNILERILIFGEEKSKLCA